MFVQIALWVAAVFLFFWLLDKWLDEQTRCPKCKEKMEKVYGWNKLTCPECHYTETY